MLCDVISLGQVKAHPDVVDLEEVLEQHHRHVHCHRLLRLWSTAPKHHIKMSEARHRKTKVQKDGNETQSATTELLCMVG